MQRVCVIGGGPGGTAAALEAAEAGSQATLFEKSERLRHPDVDWTELVRPREPADGPLGRMEASGIRVRLGVRVIAVNSPSTISTPKGREEFDAVVLATGRRASPSSELGVRKLGAIVLDSAEAYETLRGDIKPGGTVVVAGGGLLALRMAYVLGETGRRVILLAGKGWEQTIPLREVPPMLKQAAAAYGVTIVGATMTRAVGIGAVEAVVAAGQVFPCDSLVVLPRMVPCVPMVPADLAPTGAVIVDSRLRSSSPRLYAAGDCAAFGFLRTPPMTSNVASALASGRVAGANASGCHEEYNPIRIFESELFGFRVAFAGLSLDDALFAGFDAAMVSKKWGPSSQCWVVYRKGDARVLGIHLVGEPTERFHELACLVSHRRSLRELAYEELSGSIDISHVTETAREGLRRWA